MISHDQDIENSSRFTFNYVVQDGDITKDGYLDYSNEFLVLQDGELTSVDGYPVSITMPKPGSEIAFLQQR